MAPILLRAICFSAILPVTKAFSGVIRADLSCALIIQEALRLNIGIPGIFGGSIEVIVIHWQLKETIHDVFDGWQDRRQKLTPRQSGNTPLAISSFRHTLIPSTATPNTPGDE